MTARTRRGFGLVGVILMVLIVSGVGLFISYLARHADKSGRWFQHSQIAFALADAGIKQALFVLSLENSKERAGAAQAGSQALSQVFADLTSGQKSGSVSLFSSSRSAELPAALTAQIEPLAAEYSPTLEVTVEVLENNPLFNGLTEGIPLIEGERAGVIRLTARGSVKTPVGVRVERTVTMEKGFKTVSLLPPLLGRFGLFVDPQQAQDPNVFTARYEPNNGDGVAQGSVPLILKSAFAASIVAQGSNALDRAGFAGGVSDAGFLDKQGWVYLGPGDAGSEWVLKLTHGYGAAGETPMLFGDRVVVKFKDTDDAGFRKRFDDAFAQHSLGGCQSDLVNAGQQDEGLEHFVHGFASNYEIIGLEQPAWKLVGGGNSRTKMDLGSGDSSMLRLFGPPDKCSPTLVFGPVYTQVMRRASVHTLVGPPEFCNSSGMFRYNLFKIEDHPSRLQNVLQAAFAGAYAQWGTNTDDFPIMFGLSTLLSGTGDGTYAPNGILENVKQAGGGKSYSSQYFPWVSSIGSQNGISGADLDNLLNGKMDVKEIYSGDLATGLDAFRAVLDKKSTFQVRSEAFQERLLGGEGGRELSVPGVVFLKPGQGGGALSLPADLTVKRGGILVYPGPIEIRGDIKRSGPSEPLTLVSLEGDITVAASVREVQAYLVAADGQVNIQAAGATIAGGVACRGLDYAKLKGLSAPVTIAHAAETDPVGVQRASSLRAFYGGEDRIVVEGSGP